jgi:YgiT-type zinc finger domain-containing protein
MGMALGCGDEVCLGKYEEREITHTVRHKGRLVVIDHVPADVCSICGDVLQKPEIVRRIEELLRSTAAPVSSVSLYEYA